MKFAEDSNSEYYGASISNSLYENCGINFLMKILAISLSNNIALLVSVNQFSIRTAKFMFDWWTKSDFISQLFLSTHARANNTFANRIRLYRSMDIDIDLNLLRHNYVYYVYHFSWIKLKIKTN